MPVPEPVTSGRGLGGGVVLGPMVSALALRLMPLKYCCLFVREDQIDVGGEMQCSNIRTGKRKDLLKPKSV